MLALAVSHLVAGSVGFALGVYALPILIAPDAPADATVKEAAEDAMYTGTFVRDLKDSDRLHWGEGTVSVGRQQIAFAGQLAPGPDYQLYLSPQFVETEQDFERLKHTMVHVGPVTTFENFLVALPEKIAPEQYNSVIVWCETFGQFITAARYQ